MKKIRQIVVAVTMVLAPFAFGASASAAINCPVGYTGSSSTNICVSTKTYTCTVVNNNTVAVDNNNLQFTSSGSATNSGNTNGGSSTTGTATNSNGTTFDVTIKNGANDCTAVATTAPLPPATPPVTPGKGSTVAPSQATQTVPAPGKGAVAVLPDTSADSTLAVVASVIASLGLVALASRFAVLAFNRFKS